MAVAFVGLLFSNEAVLNQLSFFLVFSVLFDTLVVRSILVPCLMTLIGRWNFYPGRLPCPRRKSESYASERARLLPRQNY